MLDVSVLDVSVLEVSVLEVSVLVIRGEAGGGRGGADTALKTKTPHDNVGNNHIPVVGSVISVLRCKTFVFCKLYPVDLQILFCAISMSSSKQHVAACLICSKKHWVPFSESFRLRAM